MRQLAMWATACALALCLTACELERTDNGELDGFWQLAWVDTLATGGVADLRTEQLTWAVNGRILELRQTTRPLQMDFLFSFTKQADSLILYKPYRIDRDLGDVLLEDVDMIRPFGVNHLEEHFLIQTLNGSSMTLLTDSLRLRLRRY